MERKTIREQVAEQVAAISPVVEAKVVDALVDREVGKRVDIITNALGKLAEDEKTLQRMKPDSETFNADGSVASQGYSKTKLEERNKLIQKIEKRTKALDKAIGGDMGDLLNLDKGGGE